MLRTLLHLQQPFCIARQEKAPLLLERDAFLEHLLRQGTSLAAVRMVAWQLLNVMRLLKLTQLRDVWIDEIEEAAKKWTRQQRSNPNIRSCKHTGSYVSVTFWPSVITLKPAIRDQFKTGHRDWPKT
jgi:hypothetical protein